MLSFVVHLQQQVKFMRTLNCLLIITILGLSSGCALTGSSNPNYGGKVKLPEHGNYTTSSQIKVTPPVPEPRDRVQELTLDQLFKTYYAPYSDLFTASLRAIEALNLSLKTFNSTSGLIEFKTIQGQTYFLNIAPDKEFNSRATVKLFSGDGSRRINKDLVDSIFTAIEYSVNNRR